MGPDSERDTCPLSLAHEPLSLRPWRLPVDTTAPPTGTVRSSSRRRLIQPHRWCALPLVLLHLIGPHYGAPSWETMCPARWLVSDQTFGSSSGQGGCPGTWAPPNMPRWAAASSCGDGATRANGGVLIEVCGTLSLPSLAPVARRALAVAS
jgi:hypothetical protein